jgi:hypothetical protein
MPNKIIKVFKYLSKKISTELNAYWNYKKCYYKSVKSNTLMF